MTAFYTGAAMLAAGYASHAMNRYNAHELEGYYETTRVLFSDPRPWNAKCTTGQLMAHGSFNLLSGVFSFATPMVARMTGRDTTRGYTALIDDAFENFSTLPFNGAGRMQGAATAFNEYCANADGSPDLYDDEPANNPLPGGRSGSKLSI